MTVMHNTHQSGVQARITFDPETHLELVRRATANDRTVAAEVRRAVRQYLARTDGEGR